jgi:hypothetical protein
MVGLTSLHLPVWTGVSVILGLLVAWFFGLIYLGRWDGLLAEVYGDLLFWRISLPRRENEHLLGCCVTANWPQYQILYLTHSPCGHVCVFSSL